MFRLITILFLLPTVALADLRGRITVIDGDTVRVGQETVRIYGIDAPELDQTCRGPGQQAFDCGVWVRDAVTKRYSGKRATCKIKDQDRYGRSVAMCEVAGEDIGRWLVQEGLAFAYRRYALDYDLDEKAARVAARGLHAFAVQGPGAFRAAKRVKTVQTPPQAGCTIKGNISGSGRIYHTPGQAFYRETRINENRGERWFCSAAEAEAAGWRAARR